MKKKVLMIVIISVLVVAILVVGALTVITIDKNNEKIAEIETEIMKAEARATAANDRIETAKAEEAERKRLAEEAEAERKRQEEEAAAAAEAERKRQEEEAAEQQRLAEEAAEQQRLAEEAAALEAENNIDVATLNVGDHITFGSYEQDGDTTNGKERIEWRVIDIWKSEKGGTAMLLSEKILDIEPYTNKAMPESKNYYFTYPYEKDENAPYCTYFNCSLLEWLNGKFYYAAFDEKERERIIPTKVASDGKTYEHQVRLLGLKEVKKLLSSPQDRIAVTSVCAKYDPLSFKEGEKHKGNEETAGWWLADMNGSYHAYCITRVGDLGYDAVFTTDSLSSGVRPVIYIH